MNHAPKESLNVWIGRVQEHTNECGFYSYLDIGLFALGKTLHHTFVLKVDVSKSRMKTK